MRPVERGVYVTRLWYANVVRPKETLITAVTRDGTFLIEDGRVTRPLRDLRLTDSVLGILSRTQALGRDQTLTSDGEFYGRRFAYGVVCPALRADAVRFTGAAAVMARNGTAAIRTGIRMTADCPRGSHLQRRSGHPRVNSDRAHARAHRQDAGLPVRSRRTGAGPLGAAPSWSGT